ncbi:DNA polymerase epsilon subunit 1 [Nematocida sp. AWRm80]|nr:DNA polymerase epsilon subunit 1 [Nematocida sp. AWRm80]
MQDKQQPIDTTGLAEYFEYDLHTEFRTREGWLLNYIIRERVSPETNKLTSYAIMYFVDTLGSNFRIELPFYPRIVLEISKDSTAGIEEYLMNKHKGLIKSIETVEKTNLKRPNHLDASEDKLKEEYLSVLCHSEQSMFELKREMFEQIKKNRQQAKDEQTMLLFAKNKRPEIPWQPETGILEIHEYDISVGIQMGIEKRLNAGKWYHVEYKGEYQITESERVILPDLRIFTFDIETTKEPLKFPNMDTDKIMMISVMSTLQGWLLVNREIVSENILPFKFQPTTDISGEFEIFNDTTEKAVLERFLEIIHLYKPHVISTYNGDFFDWPFIQARMKYYGMSLSDTTGFHTNGQEEYVCDFILHLDCFKWVKRDSYLPAGSHGLKSVTKAKLGYYPDEIDPEDMVAFASTRPKVLASYSVSDAVATHFLYLKYVHPFIFSLASLIPLPPDDILRKGSGALCETLLMKEAYEKQVLIPPKKGSQVLYNYNGRMAESVSYVGGHVECLKSGVFRSDFKYQFTFNQEYLQEMISKIDKVIDLETEGKTILNYAEVKKDIAQKLTNLAQLKQGVLYPHIYHLDVGAMYPNIILTNRLQPVAITTDKNCSHCVYYNDKANCQREMNWKVRAEVYPVDEKTVNALRKKAYAYNSIQSSKSKETKTLSETKSNDRFRGVEHKLKDLLVEYSKTANRKTKEVVIEEKTAIVCQKENPFYVNAVRKFRDRRNEYKKLAKTAKGNAQKAKQTNQLVDNENETEWAKKASIYDSLQIAHKCVLNSFYGYVMKKGARWYSMEMAAVVCQTGSSIIQKTKAVIDAFGTTIELDTDGIWALLPESFPLNYTLETKEGPIYFSYICSLLNYMLVEQFSNHQYHQLEPTGEYTRTTENSIRFEIDGPYRAMFLPGSSKEGESIKKRYIVVNMAGRISELKGFEFKRRGELKFVKAFQEHLFGCILHGSTLEECYKELAKCAEYWIEIIQSKAQPMSQEEIFEYFGETRNMSKSADQYSTVKSTCLNAAERLSELLGQNVVSKGMSCSFIISKYPEGAPVTSRSIPRSVFYTPKETKEKYLRKWLGTRTVPTDIVDIIDWEYYLERLSNIIIKIIIVPASHQGIKNPIPSIKPPQWTVQQNKLTNYIQRLPQEQEDTKETKDQPNIPETTETIEIPQSNNPSPEHSKENTINRNNKNIPTSNNGTISKYITLKGTTQTRPVTETKERAKTQETIKPEETKEKDSLTPRQVIGIVNVNEREATAIALEKDTFVSLTIPLQKIVYLQTRPEIIDSLLANYRASQVNLEKVEAYALGQTQKQSFLKLTVDPVAFTTNFSEYTRLFECTDVSEILELDVSPETRTLMQLQYQRAPIAILSECIATGNDSIYAVYHSTTPEKSIPDTSAIKIDLFNESIKVLEHLNSISPVVLYGCIDKTHPLYQPIEQVSGIYLVHQPGTVPKTIQGITAAEKIATTGVYQLLEKIKRRIDMSEYTKIPPILYKDSSPYLYLDILHYQHRKKMNIIGWNTAGASSLRHSTKESSSYNLFKKDFYSEGVFEGISVSLYLPGTAILGIIEARTLLAEEHSQIEYTQEIKALENLMKNIVNGSINNVSGAIYLASAVYGWYRSFATRPGTVTENISNWIDIFQVKFISSVIRSIKLLSCDVIQSNGESIVVNTKQSTQALAHTQVEQLIKEIKQLSYGSLLNILPIQWYSQVIMISPLNYYFQLTNNEIDSRFETPIPETVLFSVLQNSFLVPLEYLRTVQLENPNESIILARILLRLYSLKHQETSAFFRAVGNIVKLSPFSSSLQLEECPVLSVEIECECGGMSIFHALLLTLKDTDEFNGYFDKYINHTYRLSHQCKVCGCLLNRQTLENTAMFLIYQAVKLTVKTESKCTRCKKPAPGVISCRCPCGGRYESHLPQKIQETKSQISTIAAFVSTVPVIRYAKEMFEYLTVN